MKIVLTGAGGFLGWHLRCRLHALTDHNVLGIERSNFGTLGEAVASADVIIHVAGVNRAETESDVIEGNIELAEAVAAAVRASDSIKRVVYANSIQAGNHSPYGTGKQEAASLLAAVAAEQGVAFVDVLLPNIFGEHGRPLYNSFVATFCREVVAGRTPTVNDNRVGLLHVQDAAQALIDGLDGPSRVDRPAAEEHGVVEVLGILQEFDEKYQQGEFPNLTTKFRTDLFNTYRAVAFQERGPIAFQKRTDPRGSLVETVKAHGGSGQTFFSTTVPGVTRGEHFHLRKIERFVVIGGSARIQLRKLFSDEVLNFYVSGDNPVAIDMPTMWPHNITNTGDGELFTLFWTDSVFDPDAPDTYAEPVEITR
jgi:UDP-2-acetamido-2,6-beta-L-arabino-hexul-4-ose reductase